jgi:transposase
MFLKVSLIRKAHRGTGYLSVISSLRNSWAKPVQAFLTEHQYEVELVCLPTYSPKLNPVERFWKHLRRQVTHNHFFQTMERLMDAVLSFFRTMAASPEFVRSVTGLAA